MIEVEKKFILLKDQEKSLVDGAEFLGEKVFTDVYYDTEDFSLTRNDKWLRARENKFEFKISLDSRAGREMDLYDEIEDEGEIRKRLNLSDGKNMDEALLENGYSKFCICKTTRKKYKKDGFGIDIDFVDFGDFNYELAEIEIMVNDKSETQVALDQIISFAKSNNLTIGYVRGKVIEYLLKKKPKHFHALVESGVVRESQI